jgi:hypothetical protein
LGPCVELQAPARARHGPAHVPGRGPGARHGEVAGVHVRRAQAGARAARAVRCWCAAPWDGAAACAARARGRPRRHLVLHVASFAVAALVMRTGCARGLARARRCRARQLPRARADGPRRSNKSSCGAARRRGVRAAAHAAARRQSGALRVLLGGGGRGAGAAPACHATPRSPLSAYPARRSDLLPCSPATPRSPGREGWGRPGLTCMRLHNEASRPAPRRRAGGREHCGGAGDDAAEAPGRRAAAPARGAGRRVAGLPAGARRGPRAARPALGTCTQLASARPHRRPCETRARNAARARTLAQPCLLAPAPPRARRPPEPCPGPAISSPIPGSCATLGARLTAAPAVGAQAVGGQMTFQTPALEPPRAPAACGPAGSVTPSRALPAGAREVTNGQRAGAPPGGLPAAQKARPCLSTAPARLRPAACAPAGWALPRRPGRCRRDAHAAAAHTEAWPGAGRRRRGRRRRGRRAAAPAPAGRARAGRARLLRAGGRCAAAGAGRGGLGRVAAPSGGGPVALCRRRNEGAAS